MPTLAHKPSAPSHLGLNHAAFSTIRFRRSKDTKGWALLGVPSQIYPMVAVRLFERRAKFIEKYETGAFVCLLFEAPSAVAAKLASVFPAPPGCEALAISEKGDRILSGKAAKSRKAIRQLLDPSELTAVDLAA